LIETVHGGAIPVAKYLFAFGYESPTEQKINADQGTDFESSNAVWIVASSEEKAIEAGRQFAEDWVGRLFRDAGELEYGGWIAGNFAFGIEERPLERYSGLALDALEVITAE
jgi:hypothetical protein